MNQPGITPEMNKLLTEQCAGDVAMAEDIDAAFDAAETTEHPSFVTITNGMRGFFAVLVWWNPEGFYEPWSTGIGSYATGDDAVAEAENWAKDEGVEFRRHF